MRRVFLLYFLWVICLITPGLGRAERPWGALNDFVHDRTHQYAMDFFIQGKPIRYAVDKDVTQEEKDIFVANFQKWPQETLKAIEKAGRQKEFKDILPLLRRPLVLEETDQDPNIILSLGGDRDHSAGYFARAPEDGEAHIVVLKKHRKYFDPITLHEIGHYFGLGDQYEEAQHKSHDEYSSDPDAKAVMAASYGSLNFDDMDGFINVLDLRLAQYNGGRFSERAQRGWKTLGSQETNFYQESRTTNRNKIDRVKDVLTLYKSGRRTAAVVVPTLAEIFDVAESTVRRDPQTGLISSITTPLFNYVLDETGWKKKASWTRTFAYGEKHTFHIKRTEAAYFPVKITEEIDGIPFRQSKALITSYGSVDIDIVEVAGGSTTYSRYKMWDFDTEDMIGANSYLLHETIKDVKVDFVIKNGKVKRVSSKEPQANLEEICQPNIRRIESFYKNFYDPLFGATKVKRQIEEKIKTNLKKSVSQSLRK